MPAAVWKKAATRQALLPRAPAAQLLEPGLDLALPRGLWHRHVLVA